MDLGLRNGHPLSITRLMNEGLAQQDYSKIWMLDNNAFGT